MEKGETMPRAGSTEQLTGGLQPLLAAMLRAAHYEELTARGAARRPAFRLTRDLIGAAIRAGVPTGRIAECFKVSVASVRTRASSADGETTAATIEQLCGLTPAQLSGLSTVALHARSAPCGVPTYRVSDLVRTVLAVRSAPGLTASAQ